MEMDKQKFISRVVHNTLKRCDDFPKDSIEIKPADLKFVLEYTLFIEECLSNLQKENEELQKENGKLKKARKWFIEHTIGQIATPEMLDKILEDKYIHKDKISEKIEYLKLNCGHAFVIDALEDLLKEE